MSGLGPLYVLDAGVAFLFGADEQRYGFDQGQVGAPAARRTVRKPLGLHGSHRPAIRFEAESPVSEQGWVAPGGAGREFLCSFLASAQPFVLPAGAAHQVIVDAPPLCVNGQVPGVCRSELAMVMICA